jgi:hypothetical protein
VDRVHVPREIQDDARPDGVARHRRASAPADQGGTGCPASRYDRHHVVDAAGEHDSEWGNAVVGCVVGVLRKSMTRRVHGDACGLDPADDRRRVRHSRLPSLVLGPARTPDALGSSARPCERRRSQTAGLMASYGSLVRRPSRTGGSRRTPGAPAPCPG